jgi:hypothetical protein
MSLNGPTILQSEKITQTILKAYKPILSASKPKTSGYFLYVFTAKLLGLPLDQSKENRQ